MEEKKRGQEGAQTDFVPTPPMLVNEISRLFFAKLKTSAPGCEITQESARLIMRTLRRYNGVSQLRLAELTHLKTPTVSVTLKRMEEIGLVRRETDAMDLRVTHVYLTELGEEHNRRVHETLHAIDAQMMQNFSPEETEVLRKLLERMRDNILSEECKKHACD